MGHARIKLVVFISGRGSNMDALIAACETPDFPAEIVLVLSNRPEAGGLTKAAAKNIPTAIVDHKEYDSRESFEEAMIQVLNQYDFDAICLAGFMRLLTADFTKKFENRMINIHPSLLPAYKGRDTHERALADGATKTGCSVHYVVPEMDSGKIIVQRAIDIYEGDTPETIAERVLEQEHEAYPEAVKILAKNILNS